MFFEGEVVKRGSGYYEVVRIIFVEERVRNGVGVEGEEGVVFGV